MTDHAAEYEESLPKWQQWTNGFLENWIFAFIVAMVIRQFFLEPFSIPTASMEPMLLGSRQTLQSDHVVVNKLTHRFTDAERWEVTVFEFPIKEVLSSGGSEQRIWGISDDEPTSNIISKPLLHRNFVKRLVVLPGDTFYIASGDIYIQKEDGSFDVARKPADVQESLWQTVYEHGADEGYLPWSAGASIVDGRLLINPGARNVLFSQPLTNNYMKEGVYRIHPVKDPTQAINAKLSMTQPQFTFKNKTGNAWDYKRWAIYRLSTKDLDFEHGSLLRRLDEAIGDIRFRFVPKQITGNIDLLFYDRDKTVYGLKCSQDAWQVYRRTSEKETLLFQGKANLIDQQCSLVALDNQLWFEVNGTEMHERIACASAEHDVAPCLLAWSGDGSIELDFCAIDRDVHYSQDGFLADLHAEKKRARTWLEYVSRSQGITVKNKQLHEIPPEDRKIPINKVYIEALSYLSRRSNEFEVQALIRKRMLGREPTDRELNQPIGVSPETAITAPENAYLLLGDNSPFSWDSRGWGWVPGTNIRGRAAWVVFPFSRWKSIR